MERLIFHVDVNSAFLSWEAAKRVKMGLPDLRDIPSCIGGDPSKRTGIVVAKSIPAKKYGIQTGEPMAMAFRKCPNLVAVPSDFELYDKCSRAFKKICGSYAPVMESFSIDEVFLDMTGTSYIYPDPVATAHELKDKIRTELGFTVNLFCDIGGIWQFSLMRFVSKIQGTEGYRNAGAFFLFAAHAGGQNIALFQQDRKCLLQ